MLGAVEDDFLLETPNTAVRSKRWTTWTAEALLLPEIVPDVGIHFLSSSFHWGHRPCDPVRDAITPRLYQDFPVAWETSPSRLLQRHPFLHRRESDLGLPLVCGRARIDLLLCLRERDSPM